MLAEIIRKRVRELPEGVPLLAKELLHLGSRAAVDQTLSRLVRKGELLRVSRGVYARPVQTRFGVRAPSVSSVVEAVAAVKGETLTPHGASAANALGLTTQVPTRSVYLTSGRSRRLKVGAQEVELRHAPAWQLTLPRRPAGQAIRALAWLGPERVQEGLAPIRKKLSRSDLQELASATGRLPTWMAKHVSALADG